MQQLGCGTLAKIIKNKRRNIVMASIKDIVNYPPLKAASRF